MSRNVKVRTKSWKSLFMQILFISMYMYKLVCVPYLHLYLRGTSQPLQRTASLKILTLTSHVKPQTQWKRRALHTSPRWIAAFDWRSVSGGCGDDAVYRRLVPSALLSCVICMQQLLWRTSYVFCWEIFGYCFKSQKITNFSQLVQDNIMEGTLNYSERYVKKSWNVRTRHRVVKSSWDVRNSHIKGTWKKPKGHIQNIWWRLRNLVSA